MSCNPVHYQLFPTGYEAGIYALKFINDKPVWFHPPDENGVSVVVTTPALITLLNAEMDYTKVVQKATQAASISIAPYGVSYINHSGIVEVPVGAVSLTLMVEPSSSSLVQVSFDGGLSWTLTASRGEVKTWGDEIGKIDFSAVRIKGIGSASFDIHGEKE